MVGSRHWQASLNRRRDRRAVTANSWFATVISFMRLIPWLWSIRRDPDLSRVLRSTVRLGRKRRLCLCVFSEPFHFWSHALGPQPVSQNNHGILWVPLSSEPFWPKDDHAKTLEFHVDSIRREFYGIEERMIPHPNSESLIGKGEWNIIPLYKGGELISDNGSLCPETFRILNDLPHCCEGGDGIGQAGFSILRPNTTILPHHGSVNVRLRYHLTIEAADGARLRVGNETRTWEADRALVFDDSFEHEVAHFGNRRRVVFLVDLWHPALTQKEREFIKIVSLRLTN
jgi:hypothetical protein